MSTTDNKGKKAQHVIDELKKTNPGLLNKTVGQILEENKDKEMGQGNVTAAKWWVLSPILIAGGE